MSGAQHTPIEQMEGDGGVSDPDATRFFVIARASAREARYWPERAVVRSLITDELGSAKIAELTSATQLLNRLIRYRRGRCSPNRIAEQDEAEYCIDPFVDDEETDPLTTWMPERPNA